MKRMKQPLLFEGLKSNDGVYPTDIDAIIEFKNSAYLIIEVKGKSQELPYGQRLALERMSLDLSRTKMVSTIVAEHDQPNADEPIILGECIVRAMYSISQNEWRESTKVITVAEHIELFKNQVIHVVKNGKLSQVIDNQRQWREGD